MNIYGIKTLFLATIDSDGRENLTVNAYGHLSGDSGTVICRAGSECLLNCETSGCKNLEYVCEDGAVCNIDPVQCEDSRAAFRGIDCPTLTTTTAASTDEYMIKKRELNKDIYEAFDDYLDKIMETKGEYDMEEDEELLFNAEEMILVQLEMEDEAQRYWSLELLSIAIGSIAFLVIIMVSFCFKGKGEYQAL